MALTNEDYMSRRKLWACIPSTYHKGEESCIQTSGELEYYFSFLGQGLLLVAAYGTKVEWNIIGEQDGRIIWAVDDTTEVLSEFYGMDVCVLDTIYNLQCFTEHNRKNLVDILMNSPVCTY